MLRKINTFKSLATLRFLKFSDRKPPKGFERFERPQVAKEQEQASNIENEKLKKNENIEQDEEKPEYINMKSKSEDDHDKKEGGDNNNFFSFDNPKFLLLLGSAVFFSSFFSISIKNQINYTSFVKDILPQTQQIELIQSPSTHEVFANVDTGTSQFVLKVGNPNAFLENLEEYQVNHNVDPANMIKVKLNSADLDRFKIKEIEPILNFAFYAGIAFIIYGVVKNSGKSGLFGLFKSQAKAYQFEEVVKVKFADVAGLDEAKKEIHEFVDFLTNSKKFKALGAKIPRGALLTGPPGTGKTMLAKACAGESGVPFFYASGSEFVEMYVGLGASRVREMFQQAKLKSPSIIFIDEIDAIGKSRSAQSGNDEGDNTLNQLLVEMDGFGTDTNVIVLAATNLPEQLDSALTRPGRLDRAIDITLPDLEGRKQVFMVHLGPLKLDPSKSKEDYAKRLATLTPGFSGAEIANLCNEAAILAARQSKHTVDSHDFEMAAERVMAGLEKKSILSKEERKVVAYHESGHAIVSWFLEGGDPLLKLTIIPRTKGSLGYAQYLPNESNLQTKQELYDKLCCILGGRCSEKFTFNQVTTGAYDDLKKANQIAYAIVTKFGMAEEIGYIGLKDGEYQQTYSKATSKIIDEAVTKIIAECTQRTQQIIEQHQHHLVALAEKLLEKDTLDLNDLVAILGVRPFEPKSNFKAYLDIKLQNA